MPWKTLDRNTVFISFSRDMTREAKLVETVIDELNWKVPEGDRWEVFQWPKSDTAWSTEASWQEHIPRTSDPRCRLLICLLGERLGEPLPEYFPLPEDLTLPSWVAFAPAAGDKRVPLTGTLFEIWTGSTAPVPAGGCFAMSRPMPAKFPISTSTAFATGTMASATTSTNCVAVDGGRRSCRRRSMTGNSSNSTCSPGMSFVTADAPSFGLASYRFPRSAWRTYGSLAAGPANVLGIRLAADPREPKGIETYGSASADFIFGRDKPIVGVLEKLKDPTESPSQIPVVALTGRSGEGKSSLLQAGLIGRLLAGQYSDFGRFVPVLLEPFRLQQPSPFSGFAQALDDALGGSLFDGKDNVSDFIPSERIDKLLQAVRARLRERSDEASPARLTGVDQVEELLFAGESDPAVAEKLAMFWCALEQLAAERLAVVVLALPTEHRDRLAASPRRCPARNSSSSRPAISICRRLSAKPSRSRVWLRPRRVSTR